MPIPSVVAAGNDAEGCSRQDAKAMYFITRDWELWQPKLLFQNARPLPGNPGQWKNVSREPAIRFRDAEHCLSNECSLKAGVGKVATQQTASGGDCISLN
jgi:hypothetical protein